MSVEVPSAKTEIPEGSDRTQGVGTASTRARARDITASAASVKQNAVQKASRLSEVDPWTAQPPSLEALVEYTRAGGWVPGEHPEWVEAPGKVYGYLVALPVTAVLYALALIVQRPSRLVLAVLVAGLLWLFI